MNAQPPPGWYPDAYTPGLQRWWDGRGWTPVTRPVPGAQPAPTAVVPAATVGAASGAPTAYAPGPASYPPAAQYPPAQYPPAGQYPPGYGKPLPVTPDGVRLASWGRRAAARILDNLLVWTVVVVVAHNQLVDMWQIFADEFRTAMDAAEVGTTSNSFELLQNQAYIDAALHFTLIFVLASAIYDIPFVALRGATPGKFALGLRIRPWERPGPPTWLASGIRWSIWGLIPSMPFIGGLFWWVDMLFPLWDSRRQAIHDKAAQTVVVRIR